MKEVSCKALVALFQGLKKQHLPPETLCKNVPYPLNYLQNKNERIEWDVYCTMVSNVRPFLSDEEFIALGYDFVRSGFFRGTGAIARLLFTPREAFHWACRTDPPSAGSQILSCFTNTIEDVGDDGLQVTMTLPDGYRYCREFFLLTQGGYAASSTLLGLGPAKVDFRKTEKGAVFDILFPKGGGTLSWLRRRATWLLAARTAARELTDANEALLQRYGELEAARTKIQLQTMQLQIAFSISEVIRRNLDFDATIEAVAQSLVDVAHFVAARVCVCTEPNSDGVNRVVMKGATPSSERSQTKTLESHGESIGEITVWLKPEADPQLADELLDQIVPSIAMEINDALSFTLLTEYRNRDRLLQEEFSRQQIESQEAERKRLAAELHDGLGQNLLVMNNELQQFLQESKEAGKELQQVASLLQESIEETREIASNLHPHHLDRLGFCAAVEAMTETLSRSTGLTITTCCDAVDHLLPKETEIHVYRIMQEALTNVVRHAAAKNVQVQVRNNCDSIEITVADDGKGFNMDKAPKRRPFPPSTNGFHGFGLSTMTERARIIGGTINIESVPAAGTTVHVSVPLLVK